MILHATHPEPWHPDCPTCRELTDPGIPATTTPEEMEAEAGRLLVESARIRADRLGPADAHELRHLWAAINAGNSDPCGVNGESCHLDAEAIRQWMEQYPKVVTDPGIVDGEPWPCSCQSGWRKPRPLWRRLLDALRRMR